MGLGLGLDPWGQTLGLGLVVSPDLSVRGKKSFPFVFLSCPYLGLSDLATETAGCPVKFER